MSPNDRNKSKVPAQSSSSSEQFESPNSDAVKPPNQGDSDEQAQATDFDSPSSESQGAEEAAWTEAQSFSSVTPSNLLDVKAKIQQLLSQSAENGARAADVYSDGDNIVGVGISAGLGPLSSGRSLHSDLLPGEQALTIFVKQLTSIDEVKSAVSSAVGASAFSEDSFPLEIVETGVIEAQANTTRVRPAPGGFSVGHYKVTAGTIGCFCRGRSAPRNARMLALSNNHVLANVNAGVYGECVIQPGSYDGGRCPADQIAILERFVPINFASGASNRVDCATAWTWHERVRVDLAYQSGSAINYFRVSSTPGTPSLGMIVGKTGRTTGLTTGRVTAVGVAVNVNYGGGRVAHFVDQVSIQSLNASPFSAGGDSGSLIWTWTNTRNPVALLYAGGGNVTFANRLTTVLSALDINLWT